MQYKVKELAKFSGVTVRTLHYYDEIGLLIPENISAAGYRLYTESDIEKLQQILFFRELDFSLQEIKSIIDRTDYERASVLKLHRDMLVARKERLENLIETVENTIESIERGIEMSKKDMFKNFDMTEIEKHKEKYAKETEEKYGNSDAYKESMKKTSKYTKEDWAKITKEGGENYERLSKLMNRPPQDPEVQQVVKQCRDHITKYFYNCTLEIFRGLGQMYVMDERFTANIDKFGVGLAQFLHEAIEVYYENEK